MSQIERKAKDSGSGLVSSSPEKRAVIDPAQVYIDAKKHIVRCKETLRVAESTLRKATAALLDHNKRKIFDIVKETLTNKDVDGKYAKFIADIVGISWGFWESWIILRNGWKIRDIGTTILVKTEKYTFRLNSDSPTEPTLFHGSEKARVKGLTEKISRYGKFIIWMFASASVDFDGATLGRYLSIAHDRIHSDPLYLSHDEK